VSQCFGLVAESRTRLGSLGAGHEGAAQPGIYALDASLTGFNPKKREGVRLYVGQTLTVDFVLEIGKLEEEIVVKASAPMIDVKDSGVVTTNVDEKTL
jgi:hypothetical protein